MLSSDNFSYDIMNWNYFFDEPFNLFDFSTYIGNFFDDFFHLSFSDNFLLNFDNFNRLRLNSILNYDFLHNCRNLNNFFNGLVHRY